MREDVSFVDEAERDISRLRDGGREIERRKSGMDIGKVVHIRSLIIAESNRELVEESAMEGVEGVLEVGVEGVVGE
jgi:hypothetical protein